MSDGPRGEGAVPAPPPSARPRSARLLALGLLAVHGVWAPLLLPVRVYSPVFLAGMFNPCIESAPKDAAIASQDLVIVNTNDFCAAYIPTFGVLHGWTLPRRVRNLAPGLGPVTVERLDARTLALSREGGFFSFGGEQLLRDPKADWQIGEPVEIGGVSYEVARLSERGLPEEFRVRFPVPLEDPSLRWMRQDGPTLRPFTPPEIGTPVEVLNGFQGF